MTTYHWKEKDKRQQVTARARIRAAFALWMRENLQHQEGIRPTYDAIGVRLGVSRERARQLVARGRHHEKRDGKKFDPETPTELR